MMLERRGKLDDNSMPEGPVESGGSAETLQARERRICMQVYCVDGTLCLACQRPVFEDDGYDEWCEYCFHELPMDVKKVLLTSSSREKALQRFVSAQATSKLNYHLQ